MTRAELHELVWSKPMTHIGRDFGMSDVAVRKYCVKHDAGRIWLSRGEGGERRAI
jgi:hypothetical protein